MAVAFFVHERESNGLGRTFALACTLPANLAPAIFCRGSYPEAMGRRVPGLTIAQDERALAFDVQMYARRTTPAVVVAVGSPLPFEIGSDIQLVIATSLSFEELRSTIAALAASAQANAVATHDHQ